uniref:Protein HID1 n=1 Tax=Parascaris equorum TaxID=6256 RepID=A0A914S1R4_PAREQ
ESSEDLASLDSCEYIWEAGVGFATKPPQNADHDSRRTEILKLLLTCFSEVMYAPITETYERIVIAVAFLADEDRMRWIARFTSAENRHYTSYPTLVLYNAATVVLTFSELTFSDHRHLLFLDCYLCISKCFFQKNEYADNFFINYLSRIHREEDFDFSTYLPNSTKKITFHQELLVLLWKCCEYNQKFMFYVLKTSDVLEILVPILYHINDSRNDSEEFSGRITKFSKMNSIINIHSYCCIRHVFHKLITTGNHRLQSLFDCLLTIVVNASPLPFVNELITQKSVILAEVKSKSNWIQSHCFKERVSPYLKSISMVAANKLIHLVEAFSTPWFLFSSPINHHLVFFLLEVFNNIIQYQFDGNSNLIYTIIRKRQVFYQLANLASDAASISKSLQSRRGKPKGEEESSTVVSAKPSLAATPHVSSMTEKGAGDWARECTETNEEIPHPILIRKYQANAGTNHWFRTYLWGIIYLRLDLSYKCVVNLLDSFVKLDQSELAIFCHLGELDLNPFRKMSIRPYGTIRTYRFKWPFGLSSDTVLCKYDAILSSLREADTVEAPALSLFEEDKGRSATRTSLFIGVRAAQSVHQTDCFYCVIYMVTVVVLFSNGSAAYEAQCSLAFVVLMFVLLTLNKSDYVKPLIAKKSSRMIQNFEILAAD